MNTRTLRIWESNSQVRKCLDVLLFRYLWWKSKELCNPTNVVINRPYGKITQKEHGCFIFREMSKSFERTQHCDQAVSISGSLDASQSVILTTTGPDHLSFIRKGNGFERGYDLARAKEMIIRQSQMFHKGSRKMKNKRKWLSTARYLIYVRGSREEGKEAEQGNFILVFH